MVQMKRRVTQLVCCQVSIDASEMFVFYDCVFLLLILMYSIVLKLKWEVLIPDNL